MPKRNRLPPGDAVFYAPPLKPNAKSRFKIVTWSTTATSKFLGIVHEDYPDYTVRQLYKLLSDKSQFLSNPEALRVLREYIDKGYGDVVPNFKY